MYVIHSFERNRYKCYRPNLPKYILLTSAPIEGKGLSNAAIDHSKKNY